MIDTDEQMLLAQQCVANLRKVLLEARKVHSPEDYSRMSEPILLEVQRREREIFEYLSGGATARRELIGSVACTFIRGNWVRERLPA